MVTPSETQRWIEAGKLLAQDPSAHVPCPRGDDGYLVVEDVRPASSPDVVERIMTCSRCGARNALRMLRPR